MADLRSSNSSLCEECGEPATQRTLRDPFGKSDATRPLCGKHGPRIRDPADVAEIERLTRRVAELQQFHDWAEPQIHDHGRDVLTIERLTRERDEAREAYTDENLHKHGLIGKYGRLRAALAELLACKAMREKIDGELSACHQEMSPQLQALENEYQLRKPLAWRDARAALSGEPTSAVETSGVRAVEDVLAERQRQVRIEGWTVEHDDQHDAGELAKAASCYALCAGIGIASGNGLETHYEFVGEYAKAGVPSPPWPWADEWWKPKNPRRDLVRAAALILAEIERIDRAPKKASGEPTS